jgi:hypothetical protein
MINTFVNAMANLIRNLKRTVVQNSAEIQEKQKHKLTPI